MHVDSHQRSQSGQGSEARMYIVFLWPMPIYACVAILQGRITGLGLFLRQWTTSDLASYGYAG